MRWERRIKGTDFLAWWNVIAETHIVNANCYCWTFTFSKCITNDSRTTSYNDIIIIIMVWFQVTRAIRQKIKGLQHQAKVVLCLGNTVFVDPMVGFSTTTTDS